MAITISDEDIAYAEKKLLPEGSSFNEQRRAFIRCLESRDVIACPGSGKTTALLAKLLILAKKMPLEDGRGICVLTHTNVAIDEIKQRTGVASDSLFRYPNFFGTIQSFVNKFLAIPRYRSEFGKPIDVIDNERFFSELEKIYKNEYKIKPWLDRQGGVRALGNYWLHPVTLNVGKTLDEPIIGNLGPQTPTYLRICEIRKALLERGILSFHDAYSISLRYVCDTPTLHEAFSNRFNMVFLDETQDTDGFQFRVLDAIFHRDCVIIQRIGDPNQGIFNSTSGGTDSWNPERPLHFSDTQRYGEPITKILRSVRVRDDITLLPCDRVVSFPPQIIIFRSGDEQQVLESFAKLIKKHDINSGPHYAVGWIGQKKDNDNLCIPSYYPDFDRQKKSTGRNFQNLISYCSFAIQITKTDIIRTFSEIIFQGIVHALRIEGIKDEESGRPFSSARIANFWKNRDEMGFFKFRSKLAESYELAQNSQMTSIELRDIISSAVNRIWRITRKDSLSFLTDDTIDDSAHTTIDIQRNQFRSQDGIIINIGTVHSVKGETHSSTLYLDTYYQRFTDSKRLIEFFKGFRPKDDLKKAYHIQNLKMAHVAFSRPKYLLAFACQESSISGHENDLMKNGWQINSVSSLLK